MAKAYVIHHCITDSLTIYLIDILKQNRVVEEENETFN